MTKKLEKISDDMAKRPTPFALKTLIKERVTEKASKVLSEGQYVFNVHLLSDKFSVKEAIESQFSVKVSAVNIAKIKGKTKRNARGIVKRSDWKKAYVTLEKGHSINFESSKVKKD